MKAVQDKRCKNEKIGSYTEKTLVNIFVCLFLSFLMVAVFGSLYVLYSDYHKFYDQKLEDKKSALLYEERNCLNETYIIKAGCVEECRNRRRIINQNPREEAIRYLAESWGLCGAEGCANKFNKNASIADIAKYMFILVIIFLMIACVLIMTCLNSPGKRQFLPMTNIDAEKLKSK